MEIDEVLPNLSIGCCPRTVDEIEALKERGVTAVLNLQTDEDLEKHGIDWLDLRARYFALGLDVRRAPIRDFDDNSLRDNLPAAVQALTELLDGGHCVFIHCNAGVNRSPSVVICYLHWVQGWELEKAARHVQACHRCAPVMEVIWRATRDRHR
jgi:protein-tyrosine phosphatase